MAHMPVIEVPDTAWRNNAASGSTRRIADEVAIAVTYDGTTHAVMMATPADLEDFAVGFSLAEGIIATPAEIAGIEPTMHALGIDLRIAFAGDSADRFWARRRAMAGPVGCGLCGIDSLKEARRPSPRVTPGDRFPAAAILAAVRALPPLQPLNHHTRAMHAAAYWTRSAGIRAVREDVGRHNALDKLCGAMARQGIAMEQGVALLTSRVSVEMVQKLAVAGCPVLVAVSAPTALAVATAKAAGITLVAIARDDGFEVFTHPERIAFEELPAPPVCEWRGSAKAVP
ncbi:formate dehydrogenase accessory sulfurtransferase FdhD [Plastoroseomonas hellenica]|uniref:formate dehydrogenase accessory sulfurtransferase FdhD n=1 Tax=Plastoroseomonas hellenica TaxID=2687306 RepID=UPI001BA8E6FF|nr:formate dehydrogenase accessory sulfurtransferase FdhD [Plastoroseomonas hellenica]MBR0645370.1 formate dehydrogenase accessory sulfurtransferase FdhD [Plastoroseomonas hellenica]